MVKITLLDTNPELQCLGENILRFDNATYLSLLLNLFYLQDEALTYMDQTLYYFKNS